MVSSSCVVDPLTTGRVGIGAIVFVYQVERAVKAGPVAASQTHHLLLALLLAERRCNIVST